jgi:hypothetical protein
MEIPTTGQDSEICTRRHATGKLVSAPIAPGERALYDREYGSLHCLRCATLWILRGAADKSTDDRERVIRGVCRLHDVEKPDALPDAIRVPALALLDKT